MGTFKDLTGQVFGRLTIIDRNFDKKYKSVHWNCKCSCNTPSIVVSSDHLLSSHTQSCGCLKKERTSETNTTHGMTKTTTHRTWSNMKNRCTNPNCDRWENYGGRGIVVCPQWMNSFETFLKDMGDKPGPEYSIDRINVNGNYEPSNCRWVLNDIQVSNTTYNRNVTINGITKTAKQWSNDLGINYHTVYSRVTRGATFEEALTKK